MRIAIAAIMKTLGGPRYYASNLIEKITDVDKENDYFILTDDASVFKSVDVEKIEIPLHSSYTRIFWDHLKIPYYLKKYNIDVYHNTKNVVPISCKAKSIVTIHDLAPFYFPGTFTYLQRYHLQTHIRYSAKKADKIIAVSRNTMKDIQSELGVPKERIKVIYNGVSESFAPVTDQSRRDRFKKRYNLYTPYLLYVGTIQPRKQVGLLIQAFSRLKESLHIPHKLYIVGRFGWLTKEIQKMVSEKKLEADVIFTGAVPEEDLPLFYNLAEVFVNPTLYEGFGLTCVEAMACGAPVVASNVSSIPEIVGDAGLLFDPYALDEICSMVEKIISDVTLRQACIEKGIERSKQFTWGKTAMDTIAVYKEF